MRRSGGESRLKPLLNPPNLSMMAAAAAADEDVMPLTIGIPREVFAGEKRVATVPEVVEKLIKLGFTITVESGAGAGANFDDEAYRRIGSSKAPSAWPTSPNGPYGELVPAVDRPFLANAAAGNRLPAAVAPLAPAESALPPTLT